MSDVHEIKEKVPIEFDSRVLVERFSEILAPISVNRPIDEFVSMR
jgi:hypothetical protein